MLLCLERATITSLLNISGFDKEEMKHYRPICHLSFTSKLIERLVAGHTEEHLEHYDISDNGQFAYCRGQSTYIVLLKVDSDIAEVLDKGSMNVLIMLDLSDVFDLIDHPILLKHLEYSFGIKKKSSIWIMSYLANKTSPDVGFLFDVPQGSVLGTKNYCKYSVYFSCQ